MLRAVLIKGNPRFIKTDLAAEYYAEIVSFMENLGVEVTLDDGADYTCPPKADFYVAHSRGCGRFRCFEDTPEAPNFIMFGDPDGIMHPKDRKWHEAGRIGIPVNEHFVFIAEQKLAIENKVAELNKLKQVKVAMNARQAAGRRPSVR